MRPAFDDFAWAVSPDYEWQAWLDTDGKNVTVPAKGDVSLESGPAVERAWRRWGDGKTGPVLAKVDAAKETHYYPLQKPHTSLFREFADIDYADRDAILDFARRYGLLGVLSQRQSLVFTARSGERRRHHAYGESHLAWALEICRMREGLKLSEHHGSFDRKRRLKELIDRHLQDVRGHLAFDPAGEPKLTIEPLTLISAMWLQLASAITGGKTFVSCKFCRRQFEISTEQTGFRTHREFCTESCKTKDYRRRRRTALKLAASSMSAAAIADRVVTDKATVKRWLAVEAERKKEK